MTKFYTRAHLHPEAERSLEAAIAEAKKDLIAWRDSGIAMEVARSKKSIYIMAPAAVVTLPVPPPPEVQVIYSV